MSTSFEDIKYTDTWTDCKTLVVSSSGARSLVYDLPEQNFPDPPDELEDLLDTACRRYEAFTGACDGEFSFEEIEADRKKYSHLTTPFIYDDLMEFDLRKCVEYMHLCYGVSKAFATSFAYRYFLIWHFSGDVTDDEATIRLVRDDIQKLFEEAKTLLDELQEDESSLDS